MFYQYDRVAVYLVSNIARYHRTTLKKKKRNTPSSYWAEVVVLIERCLL